MSNPSEQQIAEFLRLQYQLWSDARFDDMIAEFKKIVPNKLTIEYVGSEILEGWQHLQDMWDEHGGKVRTEVVELLVNGNEAATYIKNHMPPELGGGCLPSLETYRFDNGDLHVRYFHEIPEKTAD